MAKLEKIYFRVPQDDEGYPPVTSESLWADVDHEMRQGTLRSIPFFITEATLGDRVAVREHEGQLWFSRVLARSRNSLIRVIVFDFDMRDLIVQRLRQLQCATEYDSTHGLLAVSVPEDTELREVQTYLQGLADSGQVDYEEPLLRQ